MGLGKKLLPAAKVRQVDAIRGHRHNRYFRFRALALSAFTNSLPTFFGMPNVLLPAAAARMALACFFVLLGIAASPSIMVLFSVSGQPLEHKPVNLRNAGRA